MTPRCNTFSPIKDSIDYWNCNFIRRLLSVANSDCESDLEAKALPKVKREHTMNVNTLETEESRTHHKHYLLGGKRVILNNLSWQEMSRCRQEIKLERNDFLSVRQILWTYHPSTSNITESTWRLACKECGLPYGTLRRLERQAFFINYKRKVMK